MKDSGIVNSYAEKSILKVIAFVLMLHMAFSASADTPLSLPDSIPLSAPMVNPAEVVEKEISVNPVTDSVSIAAVDSVTVITSSNVGGLFSDGTIQNVVPDNKKVFTPDPTRAVWLSALCPGLGQIYNRRYWKLPIVVGGFMGLSYGLSWNNSMLTDYSKAYTDLMDNDPNTHSYMDFFPPNTTEEMLNKSWLERVLKSRKDMFRRNRDLCIIAMVGVYLIAIVDAYVDASLSNFDISPDLAIQVAPCVIRDCVNRYPAPGVLLAITF